MKLIIQIPCKNEEEQLPATLADLPTELPGVDEIEWLIIDDGSTDATIEVARRNGVHHIVRLTNNKGLAAGFQAGLDACLKLGADIIVNTDADNQYYGGDIQTLIEPILAGRADMVVGARDIANHKEFKPLKKRLQHLGSAVVRRASSTDIPDTTSGFRAYNREGALQLQVVSKYTYTLESIIQAGRQLVALDHVPIRTNLKTRESRLFSSTTSYVRRNSAAIFRVYAMYEPMRVFFTAAALVAVVGAVVWARFAWFYFVGEGVGHVQSLILGATLFNAAVVLAALGVIGDLLAGTRSLQQRTLERVRRVELQLGVEPSHYEPGAPLPAAGDGEAPVTVGAEAGPATGKPESAGNGGAEQGDRLANGAPGERVMREARR
jgi:glycosyltransferase involved in cell wall biosynthesis